MMQNFLDCMKVIFGNEGGYSDDAADRGGKTNFGITAKTLAAWRDVDNVSEEDVRNLTRAEAQEIYFTNYWNAAHCYDVPHGVDLVLFDMAVNHGPSRAIRLLQRALGVKEDAILGPLTKHAISGIGPALLIDKLDRVREEYYKDIVTNDPTQARFINGWLNRVSHTTEAALGMVGPN